MAYSFESSVADPDSFINKYLRYASKLTDAAYDYHEAMALMLLSVASQGMKLELPNVPNGLRANLYMIIYGISSHSRKSTAMDISTDILARSIPGVQLPANFTPGGLEEELAGRPGEPSALYADEFSRIIDQMHNQSYMSGLRQFLLTMYSNEKWEYRRVSKGNKTKVKDSVVIEDSHLCIAGNVTPTVTKYLQPRDIEDGFLARFAFIYPKDKPKRKKVGELEMDNLARNSLVNQLSKIRQICKKISRQKQEDYTKVAVLMDPDALDILDEFHEGLENRQSPYETSLIMTERIGIMAIKLAMLVALARCKPEEMHFLRIEPEDAIAAIAIARKWMGWGEAFALSLYESDIEKFIQRAEMWLNTEGGSAPRWVVAKRMRLSKRQMDEIQMTMLDRGRINVKERYLNESRKPTLVWELVEDEEEKSGALAGRGDQDA